MLKAIEISYRYPRSSWLFEDVNLSIHPGEIVGLFGKSGIGKSTMARILAGYTKPNEGIVSIDETTYPLKGIQPVQLVWQHPEKVINPTWKMKKVLREAGELDKELLQQLGIKQEWLNRYPSELSGGELQRFCIARALGPRTKYLIADEMTTMLDAITQAQIWHAVLKLAQERNIGILTISHHPNLLHRISDRIIDFDQLIR